MNMRGSSPLPLKPESFTTKELMMETWMIEKLEKLRKEQTRYERPSLRLPVPLPTPPEKEESERGVVVIDMCI
jgi:hypothetical protein